MGTLPILSAILELEALIQSIFAFFSKTDVTDVRYSSFTSSEMEVVEPKVEPADDHFKKKLTKVLE